LLNPDIWFGDGYVQGRVEVVGDFQEVLDRLSSMTRPSRLSWRERLALWFAPANDLFSSRDNVHRHYDLGNDFYALWLDSQLVYTCACFPTPDATLEAAQIAKLDLVCRKLALQPGDTVVETGCGWGALALHMARHYGVSVKAFNISTEQVAYARKRAQREGLDTRVEFICDDYRNVSGRFDAFVSVGMLEHVGTPDYPTFGRVIDRSLAAAGRGFLHFIGRNHAAMLNAWTRKRIFPGAYAPTLREVFDQVLEPHYFSVVDVENLRLHYAKTLEHWRRRFLNSATDVAAMFDDRFMRAWDLYLAASQASFTTGSLQLFQVVFARGKSNNLPWIRVSGLP
jgi:cyclopropane-fatty-acyl-phospholipid synthase